MDKCKVGYWKWMYTNWKKAFHVPLINALVLSLSLCGIGIYFKNLFIGFSGIPVIILGLTYQIYKDEHKDC